MDFLRRVRWPDGFRCPACGRSLAWMTARGQLRCVGCQRQTSPTAGTIFEGTRKPLRLWFQAMWYVTNQKHGVSALGVQRILGLGSYQTAWTWLHKLRRAMVRPGRDLLSGEVEVDETYLGGREVGVTGRKTNKKSIVAIAAAGAAPVVSAWRVSRTRARASFRLSKRRWPWNHSNRWLRAYNGLAGAGFEPSRRTASGDLAHIVMPRVHRVAGLLDRWWLGIHHGRRNLPGRPGSRRYGAENKQEIDCRDCRRNPRVRHRAISASQLDCYLDEFTFRFNRRRSQARGLLFYRLLQQAVQLEPVPYKMLVGGSPNQGP